MNKNIIALIGGPGSGKTTSAEYLIARGFTSFSFSDVRQVTALAHNIDPNNFDTMHEFTRRFYEERGDAIFADFVLYLINARRVTNVVLEGVRDPASVQRVISYCRDKCWALHCVGIQTDPTIAAHRIVLRGREKDPQGFDAIHQYTNARKDNVDKTFEYCDEIIQNDGPLENLYASLADVLARLNKS